MFIPMLALKFLALLGFGCLIGMLLIIVLFGPEAYRFARRELAGRFPFDFPVWWYRIKKRIRRIGLVRRAELEAYGVLIAFGFLVWVALVITHPFQ